jgi:hypothetical protein
MLSKMKTCGDYREALIDAAAGRTEPSRELRSHLDDCSSCRFAFTEESQLFAAIDTGLRASANAEVPPSLLPRVRAQLNERRVPRFSWVPAVAVLSASVLTLAIFFVRSAGRDPAEQSPEVNSIARSVPPSATRPVPSAAAPFEMAELPVRHRPLRAARSAPGVSSEEVAVLIPTGQKRGMDALLLSVQHGKVDGNVLLAEKPEQPLEELQVVPLDVSPIEVKPLADVSVGSASENSKTER